jgi:hypothetical protein
VEVIVVVNSSENSTPEVLQQNLATVEAGRAWARTHGDPKLTLDVLSFPTLPARQAGVGLARKIGMDEAAARLERAGAGESGVIACYDADCRCDPNYLTSIERHFRAHPETPGCSFYFEHPLEGPLATAVYEAIARYELHLRYYVQALRFAQFPYAYHTIGSAMAVRPGPYRKQGGMNKRQAGEDFYFLQKIMPLGGFTDLLETRVIPSPRPSVRVPFGTGRAVKEFLAGRPILTYPMEAFLSLGALFGFVAELQAPRLFAGSDVERQLTPALQAFLCQENFEQALEEIRANTASPEAFQRRFFGWFNGFRVMKCLHHARDHFFGPRSIEREASKLLQLVEREGAGSVDAIRERSLAGASASAVFIAEDHLLEGRPTRSARELLATYREWQRRPSR